MIEPTQLEKIPVTVSGKMAIFLEYPLIFITFLMKDKVSI